MAQTRRLSPWEERLLPVVDAVLSGALLAAPRPRPPSNRSPQRILVMEPWGIGDVVMVTPMLAELRRLYPDARLFLLAKPWAVDLFDGDGLIDEVIPANLPWTAFERKYDPSRYRPTELWRLFRRLRSLDLDLAFDARADARSNLVAYLSGARRRVGYTTGGASHLLTDILPGPAADTHRIDNWILLLGAVTPGTQLPRDAVPRLAVDPAAFEHARRTISNAAPGTGPVVAIHAGASHRVRQLREDIVLTVIEGVRSAGARPVMFSGPDLYGAGMQLPAGTPVFTPGLRELKAMLAACAALVCSDSGAMHIATAVGTPVIAVFGPGLRESIGPRGVHRIVQIDEMPCRPCFDSCIYQSPLCMDRISGGTVLESVLSLLRLQQRSNQRHAGADRVVQLSDSGDR